MKKKDLNDINNIIYHWVLEKQEVVGVVAHERLTEPRVIIK